MLFCRTSLIMFLSSQGNATPQNNSLFFLLIAFIAAAVVVMVILLVRRNKAGGLHRQTLDTAPFGLWHGLPAKDTLALVSAGTFSLEELKTARNEFEKARNTPAQTAEDRQFFSLLSMIIAVINMQLGKQDWDGHDIENVPLFESQRQELLEKMIYTAGEKGNFTWNMQSLCSAYNLTCNISLDTEREKVVCLHLIQGCIEYVLDNEQDSSVLTPALNEISRLSLALAMRAPYTLTESTLQGLADKALLHKGKNAQSLGAYIKDLLATVRPGKEEAGQKKTDAPGIAGTTQNMCRQYQDYLNTILTKEPFLTADSIHAQSIISTLLCIDEASGYPSEWAENALQPFCDTIRNTEAKDGSPAAGNTMTPVSRMQETIRELLRYRKLHELTPYPFGNCTTMLAEAAHYKLGKPGAS